MNYVNSDLPIVVRVSLLSPASFRSSEWHLHAVIVSYNPENLVRLKYIQVRDYVGQFYRARGPVRIWQQPPKLQIRGSNPLAPVILFPIKSSD